MVQSGFWKNVMTVLLGATGAQALPLLVAPLLTRMCTPEDIGAFSVWLGVVTVAAIASTLRLDTVMVIDRDPRQQRLCFEVVHYTATALALALTLLGVLGRLLDLPVVRDMSWYQLFGIGVGTWLTASAQTALAYAASHNLFRQAATAKVLKAWTIAIAQVGLLYAGQCHIALLTGQLIGLGAGLWMTRRLLKPPPVRIRPRLDAKQRHYLLKHQAFWRYSLPSSLLNTLVGQLPLFMIGMHHGAAAAGLFALTQRVLGAPVTLVAASVLDVFKRQAAQEFQSLGHCGTVYRSTLRGPAARADPVPVFAGPVQLGIRPEMEARRRHGPHPGPAVLPQLRRQPPELRLLYCRQAENGTGLAGRAVRDDGHRFQRAAAAAPERACLRDRPLPAVPGVPGHVLALRPSRFGIPAITTRKRTGLPRCAIIAGPHSPTKTT
jgi:hypothetical protein